MTHTAFKIMALLLALLCIPLVTVKGEGSYCMATDCSTTGAGLSLYLRVCCVNSNLGQTVHMRENNSNKHILCPPVRPRSCPPPGNGFVTIIILMIIILFFIKTVRAGLKQEIL